MSSNNGLCTSFDESNENMMRNVIVVIVDIVVSVVSVVSAVSVVAVVSVVYVYGVDIL